MGSDAARIVETHVSTLFFVDDRVYKRKRPVRTEFLDFTDLDARRAACEREVELNRRLAPDTYLGVAEVTLDGQVLDHLVVMRRFPEDRRLSARLDQPTIDDELRRIAHVMAAFHGAGESTPEIDAASGHAAYTELWEQAIEQVDAVSAGVIDDDERSRVADLARAYLRGRRPLLDGRVARGHARDGHGDLQAEDIFVLDDGPRILDCLEFDDRLRYGDTLADVAFLAMDLERCGQPELGERFLDHYQELSGDTWPRSLAHLHIAYRAHIRAKVALLRRQQGDPHAAAAARALHAQALTHLDAAQVRLVLVGGAPGTGKSVLARGLADRLGAVLVSSDQVRDEVQPRQDAAEDPIGRGRYEPERVAGVYRELLHRADLLVRRGEDVVLDASWLDPDRRAEARALAGDTSTIITELRCTCPDDLAAERIRRRAAEGRDPSEATVDVARALAASAPPWPQAVTIHTEDPLGQVVRMAEAAVSLTQEKGNRHER